MTTNKTLDDMAPDAPTHDDPAPRIITALDYASAEEALGVVEKLEPAMTNLKVGKELFTIAGPVLIEKLHRYNFRVFLDLKFHDIPNTVTGALRAVVDAGVWMINVHASGGRPMLEAARNAVPRGGHTKLIAVTVLTSLNDSDLNETGVSGKVADQVERLATLAQDCELDGVVCSPLESAQLKANCGSNFLLVTPGVRPGDSPDSDQKRVMTPAAALRAGSDYLVIGRPITQSDNPALILKKIHESISDPLEMGA